MKTRDLLLKRKAEILKPVPPLEQEELDAINRALAAIEGSGRSTMGKPRLQGKRPLDAMKVILTEANAFMSWEELEERLVAEGAALGKEGRRDGVHELRLGKKISLKYGSLIEDSKGRLGLPEWKDRLKKK
ncbi:MAG: hypothetical protein JWO13_2298 [Acidobacteriales bacterium]|nr:hypothetical protein [Terriglobales bacterium]